jgi:poly(A) polymerase
MLDSLLCIILLALQIERDTYGKLQCHPYPSEYADPSRQCAHCAFFMGLSRKEGVKIQEGQQFDIRGTVDEFRHEINMYMFWKPGMELAVSHVRRKEIPAYVFPEGYRRPRPQRHVSHQQQSDKNATESPLTGSPDGQLKRKHASAGMDDTEPCRSVRRASASPVHPKTSSPLSGNVSDEPTSNNQTKVTSNNASGGSQNSPSTGNVEQAKCSSSSQASEKSLDSIASGSKCVKVEAVCSGDVTSKHVNCFSHVKDTAAPTVAVTTTLKRVAEKVVLELVGSESLGGNNADLLQIAEKDMGNVLAEKVHFAGNGVSQSGLHEELEVLLLVHSLLFF